MECYENRFYFERYRAKDKYRPWEGEFEELVKKMNAIGRKYGIRARNAEYYWRMLDSVDCEVDIWGLRTQCEYQCKISTEEQTKSLADLKEELINNYNE